VGLGPGLRFAVTTLTVLPLQASRPDARAAAVGMSAAPAVGLALGAVAAGVALAARTAGASGLLAAVIAVATAAVLTRGLHLDGLADTVDGLGSYGDRARALDIMRKPDIGPFGVVTIVLVLLAQVAAAASLLGRGRLTALAGIAAALGAGRVAIALGCRRGTPAARPEGLGALVAGSVGPLSLFAGAAVVAAVAVPAVPGRPWQGPLAVVIALAAAWLLRQHAVRRLGGITGDVLGALCEVATTLSYVVTSM
jgi:adenosylcobinamide-GDP ribazoletransferase